MPLTSGLNRHDDTKHVGSAKRGVADGVAALDSTGDLLIPGAKIKATRSIFDLIEITDITSNESPVILSRVGNRDWGALITEGGAVKDVLTSGRYNTGNGIAKLSPVGRVESAQMPILIEEYINHTGAFDNFFQDKTSGTGTAEEIAVEHSFKIGSGTVAGSYGGVSLDNLYPTEEHSTILQMQFKQVAEIAGSTNEARIGFSSNPLSAGANNSIEFLYSSGGNWGTVYVNRLGSTSYSPVSVSGDDYLRIEIIDGKGKFFINGELIRESTDDSFRGDVRPYAIFRVIASSPVPTSTMTLDAVNLKHYKGR